MKRLFIAFAALAILLPTFEAAAHPGGLDQKGYHNDRKWGG